MNATSDSELLSQARIASPCSARWADMQGDERARFCLQCQKHVYNLSSMTTAEAAELIRSKEGNLCSRFYQRADGTMLTADCPVGVARHWGRLKAFVGAAVATLVMTFASLGLARQVEQEGKIRPRSRFALAREEALEHVKIWLGLNPPVPPALGGISAPAMGKVCVTLTPAPPPALSFPRSPQLLQGETTLGRVAPQSAPPAK